MNAIPICPSCGKPLAPDAPKGLCQECLLKAGFPSGPQTESGESKNSFVPPGIEELGAKFPQLEILDLIGRGGMGAVYKVRQKQLGRIVALKILPPGEGDQSAFSDRFTREARALAALNHPGIVTLYEFGQANGLFYFLMEFVDGVNLRQLIHAGRIFPREALAIVPQICDALQYAHDQGIVHRDIKPENILLDRRGRVKVADFGVARLMGMEAITSAGAEMASASVTLTETGKTMGTPQYMAPEQRDRPGGVDHRADIYALGVVFYQMLTGELPGKRVEAPSKKVHLDARLDEVVLRALEAEPARRYQAAGVLKTDVEIIAGSPASISRAAKSEFSYLWKDLFPGITSSPPSKTGYIRFWENIFGSVTSSGAIAGFHLSLAGFFGFVALLAIIPGMRWCLPAFGFFGMFGLIAVAYVSEMADRRGVDLSETCDLHDPKSQRGVWRRRIFWLIVAGIIPPIALFAISLIVLGARGGEVALERATTQQMMVIFAKLFGWGLGVALAIWAMLRVFRRRAADVTEPWPRHFEALAALAIFWPVLLVKASIVIWEFTLAARPTRALPNAEDWIGFDVAHIVVVALIIWVIWDLARSLQKSND